MISKIKKIFFTGVFGFLYVSFIVQAVYVLMYINEMDKKMIALALLSLEWMVIIIARNSSKKSVGNNYNNYNNNGRRR